MPRDGSYHAIRWCASCQREVTVALYVREDTVRVDCSECLVSYELPRYEPG
jgi:hypothetical protein